MEKFLKKRAILGGFVFLCFLVSALLPLESQAGRPLQKVTPPLAKSAQTEHFAQKTRYIRHGLDVNDFRVPMTNYAIFGQFIELGAAGGEWPKGSNEFYIFGAGIWVGGTVNDSTLQTFAFSNSGSPRDEALWGSLTDHRVAIGYNPSGGAEEFSGLTDIFITGHPEDYDDPDYWPLPEIVGIQDSYCEFDDQDLERWDTGSLSNAGDGQDIAQYGLGVKVIQRTHSWNYENNKTIHFFIYDIINIREDRAPIRNCFLSVMCDADVGPTANDDLVGFDHGRNLGYCYDSDFAEQGFARIPGFLAYKFLESPVATYDVDLNGDDVINDDVVNWNGVDVTDVRKGEPLGLTSFKTSNLQSGDPDTEPEKYIIMAGHNYPDVGDQRYAPFDLGTGTTPVDQRFFQNTGPFLLAAPGDTLVESVWAWNEGTQSLEWVDTVIVVGDTVRVVIAVMMAPDEETLPQVADQAQAIYDIGFILPRPPDHPNVTVVPDDQKVLISWDQVAELSRDPYYEFTSNPSHPLYDPQYVEMDFEGYKLYRSTSGLPGTYELLAQWDISSATPRHVDVEQIAGAPFDGSVSYDEASTEGYFLDYGGTALFAGHEFLVQVKSDTSFSITNLTLGINVPVSEEEDHWYYHGEPPYVFELFDAGLWSRSDSAGVANGTHDKYFDGCNLLIGGMLINFTGDVADYVPTEDVIFRITGHLEVSEGEDTEPGYAYVDSGLINGMVYYYDVIAYDFQPLSSPRSLENGITGIPVTPRSHASGLTGGSAFDVEHDGFSDGSVSVTVVNPAAVTGHDYKVVFDPSYWHLIDVTLDSTVLADQTNQSGDDNYPVVDGMVVTVIGPPIALNDDLTELYSDGLSWAFYQAYMGGRNASANSDFRNFKIVFVAGPDDINAQGFWEDDDGNTPLGYFLGGATPVSVPFEFWDLGLTLDDPSDDVRIWPLMYDFYDGTFHMDDYLVLLDKNNTGNTYAEDFHSNPDHDPANGTYWGYDPGNPASRYDWDYRLAFNETDPVWAKGDSAILVSNKPNTPDDVFTFSTSAARISEDLVNLDDILVVPNPYIVRNDWEPSRDYSRIAFTHLPDQCTIRIYSLAGDHLLTLHHESATFDGNENWDLLTKNNQKIAAGIYIFHVDSPYGEKIGKFAVVR